MLRGEWYSDDDGFTTGTEQKVKEVTLTYEIKGKSIAGGVKQVLNAGDVIHIPAGTPHQLLLDQGKDFSAFVVKIHE